MDDELDPLRRPPSPVHLPHASQVYDALTENPFASVASTSTSSVNHSRSTPPTHANNDHTFPSSFETMRFPDSDRTAATQMDESENSEMDDQPDDTQTPTNGDSSQSEITIDPRLNPYTAKPTKPCCGTDRALRTVSVAVFNPLLTSETLDLQPKPAITISEALKASEGSGTFIAYVVRTDVPAVNLHLEARRRYSDFESLQRLLRKVHPTIVVPPVPEKHSVADYASRPGKAKDDPKIIESRKKTLQMFLNRLAAHPVLGREHVLHRFLDAAGGGWTEILMESGMAHYMKKKDVIGIKITDSLLKNPDPHFLASEDYTFRFGIQLGNIVKFHRRICKHHADLAATGSDLGAAYNGWSLTEMGPSDQISHSIEAVGEAVDTTVSATSQLLQGVEDHVTLPLLEYEKLTKVIETILRWRHSRHVNYENVTEQLVTKRATLIKLESSEMESQRLSAVLSAEGTSGPNTARAAAAAALRNSNNGVSGAGGDGFSGVTNSASLSRSITSASSAASSSGGGLLATLNSFMDNDPEATRRANITKTRDRIVTLEQERSQGLAELGAANDAIQHDLDRFQRDKVHDLRNLLLMYAVAHREMCKRSLKAWREAFDSISEK